MTLSIAAGSCPSSAFELVFEPAGGRQADDRRQVERDHSRGADLLALGENAARSAPAPSSPRRLRSANGFKRRDDEGRIRLVDAVEDREADDRKHVLDLRHLPQQCLDARLTASLVRETEAPSGNCTETKNAP